MDKANKRCIFQDINSMLSVYLTVVFVFIISKILSRTAFRLKLFTHALMFCSDVLMFQADFLQHLSNSPGGRGGNVAINTVRQCAFVSCQRLILECLWMQQTVLNNVINYKSVCSTALMAVLFCFFCLLHECNNLNLNFDWLKKLAE